MLMDAWVLFPSLAAPLASWAIPALHSWRELGVGDREQPGTHRDIRASHQGWGLGSGISQAPGWAFPAPSRRIKGLGASSCSGVSRPCGQGGLDGAGIAPQQGSDLSWSVLLELQCPPDPSRVILLLQVQLEKQEFPVLLEPAPSPRQESRRAFPAVPRLSRSWLGPGMGSG